MSSPTERHTEAAAATEVPARPATPTVDGPCACELLTALVRVGRLVDAQPVETIAADDVDEELARLRESIDTAQRHADPIRAEGRQAAKACPDDMRRSTRLTLQLDLIHDVSPEELEAVVLARLDRALDEDDIDVADVTSRWEARPLP